jgi:hypothetical protein
MFYFYKTTNLINGKFYYGSGQKKKYIGSGRDLMLAIKKYGIANFKHERLRFFKTRKDAYCFEEHFLNIFKIKDNPNSYNLTNRGNGGNQINYAGENGLIHRVRSKSVITAWNTSQQSKQNNRDRLLKNNPMLNPVSKDKAVSALEKWKSENGQYMQGKKHTAESRQKIASTRKERGISSWNKGKILEKDQLCLICNKHFSKQGLKRHNKICKHQTQVK